MQSGSFNLSFLRKFKPVLPQHPWLNGIRTRQHLVCVFGGNEEEPGFLEFALVNKTGAGEAISGLLKKVEYVDRLYAQDFILQCEHYLSRLTLFIKRMPSKALQCDRIRHVLIPFLETVKAYRQDMYRGLVIPLRLESGKEFHPYPAYFGSEEAEEMLMKMEAYLGEFYVNYDELNNLFQTGMGKGHVMMPIPECEEALLNLIMLLENFMMEVQATQEMVVDLKYILYHIELQELFN